MRVECVTGLTNLRHFSGGERGSRLGLQVLSLAILASASALSNLSSPEQLTVHTRKLGGHIFFDTLLKQPCLVAPHSADGADIPLVLASPLLL